MEGRSERKTRRKTRRKSGGEARWRCSAWPLSGERSKSVSLVHHRRAKGGGAPAAGRRDRGIPTDNHSTEQQGRDAAPEPGFPVSSAVPEHLLGFLFLRQYLNVSWVSCSFGGT
ncbi:hypothetical protein EYF80_028701 [Liparis tanakae]|uniref:Uncharacterized protein n=1 Tax=Liparis tanakae TaxID=230148 RepID=A0A4Z2H5B0_9TELE|nr:hypothetical protein EYF80_028701 [Liparis tanakae]